MSKVKYFFLDSGTMFLGENMDLYYKNGTLFVDVTNDINIDTMAMLQRRVFQILDDYGIDKIIINVIGYYDKALLNTFKKEYYHKYKGYLLIK